MADGTGRPRAPVAPRQSGAACNRPEVAAATTRAVSCVFAVERHNPSAGFFLAGPADNAVTYSRR